MTTKVTIENYQSIKNASFEVDGFTVIVGKNNIGKSAVIRAIEAPLTNQVGKDFIRRGTKKTTVNIDREDIGIEWVKGASATYTIDKRDGSEKGVYSKLNRDVPAPLIEAGFGKIQVGEKKVFPFIAAQFNELFLVNKPGSTVTEVLAALYNIDTLSKADDMCQKVLKAEKAALKTRESDLKELEGKLETFADFESIKEAVAKIVEKEKETENLRSEIDIIDNFISQIKASTESLGKLRGITDIKIPNTASGEELKAELEWLSQKVWRYQELTDNLKKLKGVTALKIPKTKKIETLVKDVDQLCEWDDTVTGTLEEIKKQKEFLDNFDTGDITKKLSKLEKAIQEFNEISALEGSFSEMVIATKTTRDELKEATEKLERLEKEKADIKVCPLCERAL